MALGHMHKRKILYRDLKPESILIEKDGYIALTDFGFAKWNGEFAEPASKISAKAEYMSPELLKDIE